MYICMYVCMYILCIYLFIYAALLHTPFKDRNTKSELCLIDIRTYYGMDNFGLLKTPSTFARLVLRLPSLRC